MKKWIEIQGVLIKTSSIDRVARSISHYMRGMERYNIEINDQVYEYECDRKRDEVFNSIKEKLSVE